MTSTGVTITKIRRTLLAVLAAGLLLAAGMGATSAAPSTQANCIARAATSSTERGVSGLATQDHLATLHGNPSQVGYDARTNCPG